MSNLTGQSFGRYHILEQLGEGGMATVYKAYDTRLETDVAVKVIRTDNITPNLRDQMLKRFEREAKSLARLTHPNIVKVADYGEHEGIPYLVMPFLQGGTLRDRLKRGPLSWQESIRLLMPIVHALEFAHDENILHRDLKPANILLTETGHPMLADFGIAKILEGGKENAVTGTGVGIGTPEYMAPEQWTGQSTALSDIYSLGVVLYEMVTGRKPYIADTLAAIFVKQANDALPNVREFEPTLPEELEKVLWKAMAKNSEDRYQTMRELGDALDRLQRAGRSTFSIKRPLQSEPMSGTVAINETQLDAIDQTKVEPVPRTQTRKRSWVWGMAIALIGILVVGALSVFKPKPIPIPSPTQIITVEPQVIEALVTETSTVETPTAEPSQETSDVDSAIRGKDGVKLIFIPSGEFTMGNDDNDTWRVYDNPIHSVYLNDYWIDQTEVTNLMYHRCVVAGVCSPPDAVDIPNSSASGYHGMYYYGLPKFDNYPVVNVDWEQANAYCQWAGRRLPTEAEWEKAARGTDERIFPWGDQIPEDNSWNGSDSIVEVGNFGGRSPYGVYDMGGNVEEWVADWYSDSYLADSPYENPPGPESGNPDFGDARVVKGIPWSSSDAVVFNRESNPPDNDGFYLGFRCATSDITNIQQSATEATQDAQEEKSTYFVDYAVIGGETCENIAAGYSVSIEDILALNPGLDASCSLVAGQVITFNAPYSPQEDFSPVCENKMAFISHVTIPDGTIFTPGQTFTKTWRVQNLGTCVWNSRYALVSGYDEIKDPARVFALFENVNPGEGVDISITLTAPDQPGEYYGYWELYNALGERFVGSGLGISIEVK